MAHDTAAVPEPMDQASLLAAFGWDIDKAEIRAEKVADGLHVLFGLGGNIAVSTGDSGVLIVDDQFPELVPAIREAIASLGGDGVDFAINTHWHFDHAAGNQVLGPAGTWLVSQSKSRAMMQQGNIINLVVAAHRQPAYAEAALPVISFDDAMQFHFNGQRVDLLHFGPAHTSGDAVVVFRGANAVHMGDVFNNAGYPFIDAGNGGGIDGLIAFCRAVLATIDENTVVIPGHGPISDHAGLSDYVTMLETVRERIATLIRSGATLQEVQAAGLTAEFDERYGKPGMLIDRAYTSLVHDHP